MLVDDDAIMLEVVKVFLEDEGYHDFLITAESSRVLDLMLEKLPDVLLLDLNMPDVSGFDIMQAMQDSSELKHIPVIVLTASTDADSKLRALELGASDFLAKPVDASELILRLRNTLTVKAYMDQLTFYDPLTGLPNRNLFIKLLGWAIKNADANEYKLAVLHISVGNLKNIGISLGHDAINELQLSICDRLSGNPGSAVDKGKREVWKNLGYLGEGQYVTFLEGIDHAESVANVTAGLLNDFEMDFTVGGHNVSIPVSIGISVSPDDAIDADMLLKNANAAANTARNNPAHRSEFFSSKIAAVSVERLRLESQLKSALENAEFFLEYQPIVDAKSHKVTSVEALIRWQHPDGEVRYPGAFIDMAEQTGLIVPMGDWVIVEACRQIKIWQQAGINSMGVHVNVSAEQFRGGNLVAILSSTLDETGVSPGLLTVELTESGLMSNAEESIRLMREIKKLGVKLSIDDFGTGYSSLSYLKRFPVDQIKIDRSFIKGIHDGSEDAFLVRIVILLAKGLSLDVVAEGIELPEQSSLLTEFRCNKCQGFLFSKPLRAERMPEFVNQWTGLPSQ